MKIYIELKAEYHGNKKKSSELVFKIICLYLSRKVNLVLIFLQDEPNAKKMAEIYKEENPNFYKQMEGLFITEITDCYHHPNEEKFKEAWYIFIL